MGKQDQEKEADRRRGSCASVMRLGRGWRKNKAAEAGFDVTQA